MPIRLYLWVLIFHSFLEQVQLRQSDDGKVHFLQHPLHDRLDYSNLEDVFSAIQDQGYYGGLRLLMVIIYSVIPDECLQGTCIKLSRSKCWGLRKWWTRILNNLPVPWCNSRGWARGDVDGYSHNCSKMLRSKVAFLFLFYPVYSRNCLVFCRQCAKYFISTAGLKAFN